ncbi:hypothetical protein PPYR_14354 [Photinus pyralis]|uniref:Uncharacterized protein n=2 Tax=Photinus pyralis TaxID=7054 RepID=A0A5N4A4Z4_PHOPY|nr:uncharacterized protein LOC116181200 [Photinus pyralis]KAB0792395.1 hypothetical protein PPYR_14354 [Photinus pyralis]
MKYCAAFALLLVATLQVSAEDDMAEYRKLVTSCAEKEGISPDVLKEIETTGKRPAYSALKCVDKCILEKTGVLGADGKVDVPMLIKNCLKHPKLDQAKCERIIKECPHTDKGDKCLMSYEGANCMHNNLAKVLMQ